MRRSPFGSAFLATFLVFAALNAVSYFVRSGGDALLGGSAGVGRIGFPWLVWQDGAQPVGGFATVALGADGYFDYGAMALNAASGLATSGLFGLLAKVAFRTKTPGERIETSGRIKADGPPQFSLRSLLIATAAVSVVLAFQRTVTDEAHAFSLAAIYLGGPSLVVCCAWAVRGRKNVGQMIAVCSVLAMLVAAALAVGTQTERGDFTRVLLGLFVYWVPQCVAMVAVRAVAPAH